MAEEKDDGECREKAAAHDGSLRTSKFGADRTKPLSEEAHERLSGRQILLFGIVLSSLIIDGVDMQLLAFVAPIIISEWGLSNAEFGPALSAALIGMTLGAPLGGIFGDRWGRARILTLSVFLFGAATLATAAANGLVMLSVLRFLGGLGFAAATPNAVALSSDWLPPRFRARAAAILSTSAPIGGMIGAGGAAILITDLGWRGIFLACGGLTMALCAFMWMTLPTSPILGRVGQLPDDTVSDTAKTRERPGVTQTRALATVSTSIFSRKLARFNAGVGLAFFAFAFVNFALLNWIPSIMTNLGLQIHDAIRSSFFYNIAALCGAAFSTIFVLAIGTRILLIGSGVATVVLLIVFQMVLIGEGIVTSGSGFFAMMALIALLGFVTGTTGSSIYALLGTGYPVACRSTGVGFGVMLGRLGGIVTVLISGITLSLQPETMMFFFLALILAAGSVAAAGLLINRHVGGRWLARRSDILPVMTHDL